MVTEINKILIATIKRLNAKQRVMNKSGGIKIQEEFIVEKNKILPDLFKLAEETRFTVRYDISGQRQKLYFDVDDRVSIMYSVDEILITMDEKELSEYLEKCNVEYV